MNKIIHYKSYDLKSMRKPNLIAVTHANDVDTQFIELHLLDGGNPVTLSASYTYTETDIPVEAELIEPEEGVVNNDE